MSGKDHFLRLSGLKRFSGIDVFIPKITLLQSRLYEDLLEKARAEISGVTPGVQDISLAGTISVAGLECHPLGNALKCINEFFMH